MGRSVRTRVLVKFVTLGECWLQTDSLSLSLLKCFFKKGLSEVRQKLFKVKRKLWNRLERIHAQRSPAHVSKKVVHIHHYSRKRSEYHSLDTIDQHNNSLQTSRKYCPLSSNSMWSWLIFLLYVFLLKYENRLSHTVFLHFNLKGLSLCSAVPLCGKFNESGAVSELSFAKWKAQQYLIKCLYFLWLWRKAQVHVSSSWCSDTWARRQLRAKRDKLLVSVPATRWPNRSD